MQKRTDRNKSLHERIDREIEKVANQNSNKEFQSTNEKLKILTQNFLAERLNKKTNKTN